MKYVVIIEKSKREYGVKTAYSAYLPDLPGCIAAADTREEVIKLLRESVEFHLEGMKEDGEDIPQPSTITEYIEI